MKKLKISIAVLVLGTVSAFAMNAANEGQIQAVGLRLERFSRAQIDGARRGIRADILSITGTCRWTEKRQVETLLNAMRGCDLTNPNQQTIEGEPQKKCLRTLKEKWTQIDAIDCKEPFLRDTQNIVKNNLIAYLDWTFSALPDQFDARLTYFLEFLSYWENETREALYLPGDVSARDGLDGLYQLFSNDLNQVHSKIANLMFEGMKNRIDNFDSFSTRTFFEKEIPYLIVTEKLYTQDHPGPITLAHFTGLVLNSIVERARFFISLNDLGCSLQSGCQKNELSRSEVYSVFLLTSLLGESELTPAKWQYPLANIREQSRDVFRLVFENHSKLIDALRVGMTNKDIAIQEADTQQFEPLVIPLVSVIQEAKAMIHSFEENGQFNSKEKEFPGAFTSTEMDKVNLGLNELKHFLEKQRDTYLDTKINLAHSLRTINEDHTRTENTLALMNSVGYELRMAQLDLEGLQGALRKEAESLGNLITRSTALVENSAYQDRFAQGSFVSVITDANVKVSAKDASYFKEVQHKLIEEFAVKPEGRLFQLDLEKGDLITAQVTGKYSPTCAISKEYEGVDGISSAETGPEGFIINASNRRLKATSSTETTGTRETDSLNTNHTEYLEGCGSSSVSASVGYTATLSAAPLGIGASASVSVSASYGHSSPDDCRNKVTTNNRSTELSQTDSKTNSAEMALNASFERGMRSEFTPFSTAPVGALIAVEMDSSTQKILHMRVVHRNTTFTASHRSRLYFVVNDCKKADANDAQLSVIVNQKRSPVNTTQVTFLMNTIADLSLDMGARLKHFLKLGEISSRDLDGIGRDLKQWINDKLESGEYGFFRLSDFPLLDELIQNWIQSEVTQIERKVRIRQTERKIQLLYMKHRDLVNQNSNHNRSNFLNSMIADWTYKNMDYRAVLVGIERVVQYLNYRVLPIYHTVNPGVLSAASVDFRDFLKTVSLNTEPLDLAIRLIEFIDRLRFSDMMAAATREQPGKIVVSFPKTEGDNAKYRFEIGSEDGSERAISTSSWASAPFPEAARVWHDFLKQNDQISFHVDVNSIYSKTGGRGRLSCFQRASFLEGMAVVFVLDRPEEAQILNFLEDQRPVLLPQFINIPNIGGMEKYRVASNSQYDSIPIKFSSVGHQVLKTVTETNAIAQGAARGVTPIGTFTLSGMKSFYNDEYIRPLLEHVHEILLVFQHKSLNGPTLDWIQNCK